MEWSGKAKNEIETWSEQKLSSMSYEWQISRCHLMGSALQRIY
jgi:hypothetical protein